MGSRQKLAAFFGAVFVALLLAAGQDEAHTPITSKYTYNDDVFPIFREHCGRCHVAGGVAPMSLMTYNDARPWAESIRGELVAAHMPPWNAELGDFKKARRLSARDFDVILTWATGGSPLGDPAHAPQPVALKNEWPLGRPDLSLPLPTPFTLAADRSEDVQEFTLPVGNAAVQWIRAVDLLPGTPAIVRSAIVSIKSSAAPDPSASATVPEQVLAVWVPGQEPVALDRGAAFAVPPHAELAVRIHYKKTWADERKVMTDRSSVGLYFAESPATQLRALILSSAPSDAGTDRRVSFTRVLDDDLAAIALRPDEALADVELQLHAVLPDGSRALTTRLNVRSDWAQRYWLAQPVPLPRGTRINVVATPGARKAVSPVRVTLDVLPMLATHAAR